MSEESSKAKSTGKFIITVIGLGIIGLVFGVIGALIGGRLLVGASEPFAALGLAILGLMTGYLLGVIIGIVLLKRTLHQSGSLLFGIPGSIIGVIISFLLLLWYPNLLLGYFILVPALCLAGFYLKR